jgi:hypothetical protein
MSVIREAIARQRPCADYFGFAVDRAIAEVGVAEELCGVLAAEGRPLASHIESRGGDDPPDCQGIGDGGARIAIEITELVDPDAIKAAKAGRAFDWADWTREKLLGELQLRLNKKDKKLSRARGGPYDAYVVIIHTDEPLLNIECVRSLLDSAHFRPTALVDRAFLLLSFDPKSQSCPFIELQFSEETTAIV